MALGVQLPHEIAEFLKGPTAGGGERFDSDEFFHRVCDKEGVDLPDAVYHARVVLEVLQEAVSPGEIDDVRAQLPPDYRGCLRSHAAPLRRSSQLSLRHTTGADADHGRSSRHYLSTHPVAVPAQ